MFLQKNFSHFLAWNSSLSRSYLSYTNTTGRTQPENMFLPVRPWEVGELPDDRIAFVGLILHDCNTSWVIFVKV